MSEQDNKDAGQQMEDIVIDAFDTWQLSRAWLEIDYQRLHRTLEMSIMALNTAIADDPENGDLRALHNYMMGAHEAVHDPADD